MYVKHYFPKHQIFETHQPVEAQIKIEGGGAWRRKTSKLPKWLIFAFFRGLGGSQGGTWKYVDMPAGLWNFVFFLILSPFITYQYTNFIQITSQILLKWVVHHLLQINPFHMENLVQLRVHSYNLLKTAQKNCSLVYNFAQTFVF